MYWALTRLLVQAVARKSDEYGFDTEFGSYGMALTIPYLVRRRDDQLATTFGSRNRSPAIEPIAATHCLHNGCFAIRSLFYPTRPDQQTN